MAGSTSFLDLLLPGNGEYTNVWDEPINQNWNKIATWAESISGEIQSARFTASDLGTFLAVGHESSGELKPTPEMIEARISLVYGDRDPNDQIAYSLRDRLEKGDREVFDAREGEANLRESMALRSSIWPNMILTGAKDINGYPSWLSYATNKVQVNGSGNPITLIIDGFKCRIRKNEEIPIAGAANTYFLYAQFQANGVVIVNGDVTEIFLPLPPPLNNSGTTLIDPNDTDGKHRILYDANVDFAAADVQPNDIITISQGNNEGIYIIDQVSVDGDPKKLKIRGRFPQGLSGQGYIIKDPLAVTLSSEPTKTPADGKMHIGESVFDSVAVTSVKAYHFKNEFVGDWRAVDVSTIATFEEIWNHNLGTRDIEVFIQATHTNTTDHPLETLSEAALNNDLGISVSNGSLAAVNNTPSVTQPTLSVGDQVIATGVVVGTNVSLSGNVSGSLTGSIVPAKSVRVKYDRTRIWVKNAVANLLYKDYDDTVRQQGFIRVIIRKRG